MEILLAIVLSLLAISLHELGHYEAMRRCGVRIREIALLGMPFPKLPHFRLSWLRGETRWSFYPFLIGAYVLPFDNESIDTQSTKNQLYMLSNGITANLVYGFGLFGVCGIMKMITRTGAHLDTVLVLTCISGLFSGVLWWARRYVCLVLPILSIPIFILLIPQMFFKAPMEAIEAGNGGVIAMGLLLQKFVLTPIDAVYIAGAVSIALGLGNLLPIFPCDGGQIIRTITRHFFGVQPKFEAVFEHTGAILIVIMILYTIVLDGLHIGLLFFK